LSLRGVFTDTLGVPAGVSNLCVGIDLTRKDKEAAMTFTRTLGWSGIQVNAMGMGCWAIGGPFLEGETPLG
jgi:hypothetical protein